MLKLKDLFFKTPGENFWVSVKPDYSLQPLGQCSLRFLGIVNSSEFIILLLQCQLSSVLGCLDSASSTWGGGGAFAVEDRLPHSWMCSGRMC